MALWFTIHTTGESVDGIGGVHINRQSNGEYFAQAECPRGHFRSATVRHNPADGALALIHRALTALIEDGQP